ncbi:MAG TPA: AIR synthase-related protein, partial [Candidatus Norongarragalinales archaeon]|nr:AIR synthase-related protein [Candidatus Norongarragalinales archaeon]
DSVQSDANPDGKFKMAQLVRLCQGVHDYSVAMGIPFVSGKDSMKNDLVFIKDGKPHRISVPPTLLISLVAKVDDYRKTVSIDFKKPGDLLYVIGTTKEELAGSTFAESLNVRHHRAPSVDPDESKKMFEKVSRALEHASSAYYVSQGGLALAISECALAGNLGAEVDLNKVPNEKMTRSDFLWASESQNRFLVTVRPEKAAAFEEALEGQRLGMVGKVLGQKTIKIKDLQNRSLEIPLQEINDAYTAPLREDLPVIKV